MSDVLFSPGFKKGLLRLVKKTYAQGHHLNWMAKSHDYWKGVCTLCQEDMTVKSEGGKLMVEGEVLGTRCRQMHQMH